MLKEVSSMFAGTDAGLNISVKAVYYMWFISWSTAFLVVCELWFLPWLFTMIVVL